MGAQPECDRRQLASLFGRVVDAGEHRPLDRDPPSLGGEVLGGRSLDLGERVALVDREQRGSQLVVGGVEADRQLDGPRLPRKPPHSRNHPDGGHGDRAGRHPDVFDHPTDRLPDPVVVGEGFTHPHEDDVGDPRR